MSKKWLKDIWYIDFNNILTSKLIYNGENSHGEEEIGKRLLNLLKKNDPQTPQYIERQLLLDDDSKNIELYYKYELWTEDLVLELVEKVDVLDENGRRSIDHEYDDPDFWLVNVYSVYLPLWYLVTLYVNSFHNHAQQDNEYYKNISKKELWNVLHTLHTTEEYINHDRFTLFTNGKVMNLGW